MRPQFLFTTMRAQPKHKGGSRSAAPAASTAADGSSDGGEDGEPSEAAEAAAAAVAREELRAWLMLQPHMIRMGYQVRGLLGCHGLGLCCVPACSWAWACMLPGCLHQAAEVRACCPHGWATARSGSMPKQMHSQHGAACPNVASLPSRCVIACHVQCDWRLYAAGAYGAANTRFVSGLGRNTCPLVHPGA